MLVVLRVASTEELIQRTYHCASGGMAISNFMIHWMESEPRNYRKEMSYSGAVRFRPGMDGLICGKGDWTDPMSGQRYFDPGNDVYSRAFHLAFPDISAWEKWNAETQGDILEGLLALKFLDSYRAIRNEPGYPHFPSKCPAPRIAAWIEELVTLVWSVGVIYPSTDPPAEWAKRWHEEQ